MRRLLFVGLLMLCLSFPIFAGHTLEGGYCAPCGLNGCLCNPGEEPQGNSASQFVSKPTDLGPETLLILGLLLLVLRYKP